jgi:hypothetical protein
VLGLDVLVDQGGTEQRRRWPGISALGSALRGPRAHAGPRTIGTACASWLKCAAVEVQRDPPSSLPIVQLAATVSRLPFGRRTRSAPPNLDAVTT